MPLKTTVVLLLAAYAAADICGPVYERKNTDGLTCGAEGSVANPAPLIKATTISTGNINNAAAACRNNCLDNKYCKSYSFNRRTRLCQLYTKIPTNQGFKASSNTGNYFTDRLCFIQNFDTSPGFVNGGFDGSAYGAKFLSPWYRGSNDGTGGQETLPSRYSGGYQSPYAALMQVGTAINVQNTTVGQIFDICPNTTMTITPMYKYISPGNSSADISFQAAGATSSIGQTCTHTEYRSFRRDQPSRDWTVFRYCDPDPEDPESCPPLKMTVVGGHSAQSVSVAASLSYNSFQNDENYVPPVHEQFLFDFVVTKIVSNIPNNQRAFCGFGVN